jgi:hypothetical protein
MLCRSYRRLCRKLEHRLTSNQSSPRLVERNLVERNLVEEKKKARWKGSSARSKQ